MIRMALPQGTRSVSFGGESYHDKGDGTVEVPDSAEGQLLAHGLRRYAPKPADPTLPKAPQPGTGKAK